MKKLLKKCSGLFLCFVLAAGGILPNAGTVKAAANVASKEAVITYVDDIKVYNSITPTTYTLSGEGIMVPVKLEQDCMMTFLVSGSDVKYMVKSGDKIEYNYENLSVQLYRDSINAVNRSYNCVGGSSAQSAQSDINYLDKGTYWICIKPNNPKDGASGTVQVGVAVEKGVSEETYRPSTYEKPNVVKLDQVFKGFLTQTNNKDWYEVTIPEASLVTFNYRQQETSSCYFELYDSTAEQLYRSSFEGSFKWANNSIYLEQGKYYFALQSSSGGANTEVKVTSMKYYLDLEPSTKKKTNKNVTVKVKTNCTAREIKYIDKEVVKANMSNDSYWYMDYNQNDITTSKKFVADHNGIYSVRITDMQGIQMIATIKISNIDKKAPATPAVKTYKKNTSTVKGTGEKNAKVYVKIGKKTYTGKVNSSKKYSVKTCKLKKGMSVSVWLKDSVGNKSKTKTVKVK